MVRSLFKNVKWVSPFLPSEYLENSHDDEDIG